MTLSSLQLFRFMAAVLVILFHMELMKSGYKGVDLFFVISGFVMYYSTFIAEQKKAWKFVINRLTKIFILYWIALLVLYAVQPFDINRSILRTFFLLPGHFSVLGVSWSLSYELYFYFAFGIIVFVVHKKFHQPVFIFLLILSSIITILNNTYAGMKGTGINFLAGPNAWEFLLGISAARLFSAKFFKTKTMWMWSALVIILILYLFTGIRYNDPKSIIIYGSFSFLLVLSGVLLEKKYLLNPKLSGIFKILGDSSYCIYLFSPIVILVVKPVSHFSQMTTILTIVLISVLINRFIENNLLRVARKKLIRLIPKTSSTSANI